MALFVFSGKEAQELFQHAKACVELGRYPVETVSSDCGKDMNVLVRGV